MKIEILRYNSHARKRGVATLSSPQGIEFDKTFWWFQILSRVDSCKKTADRNFFPDGLDNALTIISIDYVNYHFYFLVSIFSFVCNQLYNIILKFCFIGENLDHKYHDKKINIIGELFHFSREFFTLESKVCNWQHLANVFLLLNLRLHLLCP